MEKDIMSIVATANELFRKYDLSDATIRTYQERSFNQVIRQYQNSGDNTFRLDFMEKLLADAKDQHDGGTISRKTWNWRRRGILILIEISETGTFQWKVFNANPVVDFPEPFALEGNGFLESIGGSQQRRRNTKSLIIKFCHFINDLGISCFEEISADHLKTFIAEMHKSRPNSMDEVVSVLKKFFHYLENNGHVLGNHWQLFSSPRSRDHKVKPAMKQMELVMIINQVNRHEAPGKRDFAILSLAVTTGLRAGDIAALELSDIYWRELEIHLAQGKTGKGLVLPLQTAVRDALADYILNERPQSESRKVFLRSSAPFNPLQDGVSIACIFRKYLRKAGIEHTINDGRTFHGIRRSVGTAMVSSGIPVTTVSQVLGHQEIRATKQYIALDLQGLQKCALPMSSIGGVYELP